MLKFWKNCGVLLFLICVFYFAFFVYTVCVLPPVFIGSYQSTIQAYHWRAHTAPSPKMYLISSSTGAFGLDAATFESLTPYTVINLGISGALSVQYEGSIVLHNVNPNDLVVISLEQRVLKSSKVLPDPAYVVTGMDGNLTMYRYLSPESYVSVVRYFPTYFFKKLSLMLLPPPRWKEWTYSASAFDGNGNMTTYYRPLTEQHNLQIAGYNPSYIDPDMITYINSLAKKIKDSGADVVFSFPPLKRSDFIETDEELVYYAEELEKQLDFSTISDILDYMFTDDLIYNTTSHMNTQGSIKRSELLARDINSYLK